MKVRALVFVVVVVALTFPTISFAASRTTGPGRAVLVRVNITDKGINTYFWAIATTGGGLTYVSQTYILRGEIAYFTVRNRGRKPHNFVALGRKTPNLRPGGKATFHLVLTARGAFPYESTLDKGNSKFRGVFTVN
jgi:hypothetical protein